MNTPRRRNVGEPWVARGAPWMQVLLVSGCAPSFEDDPGAVDEPRVLAVEAFPAEARPGQEVTLRAHLASSAGPLETGRVAWRLCTLPTPYTEEGPIDSRCLDTSTPALGTGPELTAALPSDACSVWGPSSASKESRARDPDSTGGFYQPVVLEAFGEAWLHLQRVKCALTDLPRDTAHEFSAAYVVNENPTIKALEGRRHTDGAAVDWTAVEPAASIELRVVWTPESAEDYAWVDPSSRQVRWRREGFRVSWLATSGVISNARTGVDEDDRSTHSTTGWTAPSKAGTAHLWTALRDSRGGTAIAYQKATFR